MRTIDFQQISESLLGADRISNSGDSLLFSLTNGLSHARVVSVSPGIGPSSRLRDEDVSTSCLFSGDRGANGFSPPVFVLDLGLVIPQLGRLVILHDDGVPGAWVVTPDEAPGGRSVRFEAKDGVTTVNSLDFRARRLHFRWEGEVPLGGFAAHEVAVFLENGLPASEVVLGLPSQLQGPGTRVPGPSGQPTGGVAFPGVPEISPQSP